MLDTPTLLQALGYSEAVPCPAYVGDRQLISEPVTDMLCLIDSCAFSK